MKGFHGVFVSLPFRNTTTNQFLWNSFSVFPCGFLGNPWPSNFAALPSTARWQPVRASDKGFLKRVGSIAFLHICQDKPRPLLVMNGAISILMGHLWGSYKGSNLIYHWWRGPFCSWDIDDFLPISSTRNCLSRWARSKSSSSTALLRGFDERKIDKTTIGGLELKHVSNRWR